MSGKGKRSGGTEFSSQAAMSLYLQDHPKADVSKHRVVESLEAKDTPGDKFGVQKLGKDARVMSELSEGGPHDRVDVTVPHYKEFPKLPGQKFQMGTSNVNAKRDGDKLTIMSIRVDPEAQKSGLATAMIGKLVEEGKRHGLPVTTSGVLSSDGRALAEHMVAKGLAKRTPDNNYVFG